MMPPFRGWYAGVGSRQTPEHILELMRRISYACYNAGFALSSGDAEGADTAFYEGALQSPHYYHLGSRIYLAWNGVRNRYADPKNFFYDASKYSTWESANSIAKECRGSWEGLGRGGIAMHTRNVFQIMGHSLTDPVRSIIYWGIPVGKTEKVKGGTNTALQLAIKCGVPKRINLYTEEGLERATQFVDQFGHPLKVVA